MAISHRRCRLHEFSRDRVAPSARPEFAALQTRMGKLCEKDLDVALDLAGDSGLTLPPPSAARALILDVFENNAEIAAAALQDEETHTCSSSTLTDRDYGANPYPFTRRLREESAVFHNRQMRFSGRCRATTMSSPHIATPPHSAAPAE